MSIMHTNLYYLILTINIGGAYLLGGEEGVERMLEIYQKILGDLGNV